MADEPTFIPPWPPELPLFVRVTFAVWFLLFIIWLPLIIGDGMAFEGNGPRWKSYSFVIGHFSYPITVGIAWLFKRKLPALVFLPLLSLSLVFLS
jgi:hypothetical protein